MRCEQRRQAEGAGESALIRACSQQHGFVVDDLIAYFLGEEFFRLVVNAATRRQGHRLAHAAERGNGNALSH
jgi:glycine cleavage system aminomethyltransferase T